MSDTSDSPPEPGQALVPAAAASDLDAHGFDPADFEWVPVLRKPRADGWTPQRQVDFIAALADTGSVTAAAREIGLSIQSCYRLRRSPGGEKFAAAWDAAIQEASKRLADIAFDRAVNGVEEPLFDKEGRRIASRIRYNDRLLMFLLRAHQPERYRHAHQSLRYPKEPPAPALPPVAEALQMLEPAPPADPHLLMAPDELEAALECAHIMDGELPHWHRYTREEGSAGASLGPDFEAALERAKGEAADLPRDGRDDDDEDEEPFLA